ncbi:ankycorbin-like [Entelurus aequoreus]|uniref:ankycorbin-like n=1 Tax=Entelurus aequoreus TaxID=161455 RepID=UPI002B1DD877|nr:ankycorbin-like [Entelurus aequoreus]XP_061911103.1 ankycorbin-like [Entelurus aequoreus]XP_061911104.1 ankycorbin-like [Entelurus aequoreus]
MKSLKAKFRKTDANEWNKNDERLLAAVEHGEVDKVASLVAKKGASAVKLDSEGKSAVHVAASRGHTDCLSVLLAHGADPTLNDASGVSPLHLAAKNNHVECCRKLLQNKCPVDALDGSGRTALHHAALGGKIQTVHFLCELKSPVNLKDSDGHAPLLLAAAHGHAEVCSALLDRGADIGTCDKSGRTAMMLAAESNAVSVIQVLVQRGATLSAVDAQGHDVAHYANVSASCEVKAALSAARTQQLSDVTSARGAAHDAVALPGEEQVSTPKKRKAPPPPMSTLQKSAPSSPCVSSNNSDKRSNCKEDEAGDEDHRRMLQETMDDSRSAAACPEADVQVEPAPSSALVSALQDHVSVLTLENQQLAAKLETLWSLQGSEQLKDSSRPHSRTSNSSVHSTRDHAELAAMVPPEDEGRKKSGEEIWLLRQMLDRVQAELMESREENFRLQAQLKVGEEDDRRSKGKEEELLESLAELQAKLSDTQKRYHHAVEELRGHAEGAGTSSLEQEVLHLKAQLLCEQQDAAQRVGELEGELKKAEEQRRAFEEQEQRMEETYKEAQEEISLLQEALQGTVPVEAAAKDFQDMKTELNQVISGLQSRLVELSHSYSQTRAQLGAAHKQLEDGDRPTSPPSQQEDLAGRLEELQTLLADTQDKHAEALEEISQLRMEAEVQVQSSVSLGDHTRVMSSLGNAVKELESQSEALKAQLHQKTLQVDALQNRLEADKHLEDVISLEEHNKIGEQLEGQVSHLTQLLQEALRKQDEMALEAADAWQKGRDYRAERDVLQEQLTSTEKDKQSLSDSLRASQDAILQLKVVVEKHVASERDKNKRIDDLSREVNKLKDALNSLSQLSYSSAPPTKRQQLENMQQQVKHLQYQLAESKKQHHDIVSVYRMHLLYAVQGQMDEDVQKALKQILIMCKKMPKQSKDAC